MSDRKVEARPGMLEPLNNTAITFRYMAPPGTTLEHVQRPDFWRNNARELGQQRVIGRHAYNRIEVLAEDGTWECMLRVMAVADGLVTTRLLHHWTAPTRVGRRPNDPEGYTIEHIIDNGWRALDTNGEPVVQRQTTRDDAVRAAADHARRAKGD